MPSKFKGVSLNEIHHAVGTGRQKFTTPYAFKLHGVEVVHTFDNEILYREFKEYVQALLTTVGDDAIIIAVGDMVLGNNLIERVQYIAEQVEIHTLSLE